MAALQDDLPADIWGLIADYSTRDVILNLRTVHPAIKEEVEHGITKVALRGEDQIVRFACSSSFANLSRIKLNQCTNEGIIQLARALVRKPREGLWIDMNLMGNVQLSPDAYSALQACSLAGLSLTCGALTTADAQGFGELNCPISIEFPYHGLFDKHSLYAAATIPKLRDLRLAAFSYFDDDVARAFKSHPTLRKLTYTSPGFLSETGVRDLAVMPQLQQLALGGMLLPIGAETTQLLAASRTLKYLSLHKPGAPLDEAAVRALSCSKSLETMHLSLMSGIRHLAAMEKLRVLHLYGDIGRIPDNAPPLIVTLADATSLVEENALCDLRISNAIFADDALNLIAATIGVRHLQLSSIDFNAGTVAAIMSNTRISSLDLVNVKGVARNAFAGHPTLQHIGYSGCSE